MARLVRATCSSTYRQGGPDQPGHAGGGWPQRDFRQPESALAGALPALPTRRDSDAPGGTPGPGDEGLSGEAPLAAKTRRPDASFDTALAHIVAVGDDSSIPGVARTVLLRLSNLAIHALADAWLAGTIPAKLAGEALPIAAALQVWFTRQAALLTVDRGPHLSRRGLCPACASDPVAGVITASGKAPGARYLYCGLCATAWNHVRVSCNGCGESKGLALQEVEGGTGAVKAEACDSCHGYAKMFYQGKDKVIESLDDDLASLGLDLMVSDSGWTRLAPNPLVSRSFSVRVVAGGGIVGDCLIYWSGRARCRSDGAAKPDRRRKRRSGLPPAACRLPRKLENSRR